MSISDCSLLPLLAAQLGAEKVMTVEKNGIAKGILADYVKTNGLSDKINVVDSVEEIPVDFSVDVVIGDPFFFSSLLPWHNLHFWFLLRNLRRRLGKKFLTCPKVPKDLKSYRYC